MHAEGAGGAGAGAGAGEGEGEAGEALAPCTTTPAALGASLEGVLSAPGFTPSLLALAVEELLAVAGRQQGGADAQGRAARLRIAQTGLRRLLEDPRGTRAAQPSLRAGPLARALCDTGERITELEAPPTERGGMAERRSVEELQTLGSAVAAAEGAGGAGGEDPRASLAAAREAFGGEEDADWALRRCWNAVLAALAAGDSVAVAEGALLLEALASLAGRMLSETCAPASRGRIWRDAARITRLSAALLAVTHLRLADAKLGYAAAGAPTAAHPASAAAFPHLTALLPSSHLTAAMRAVATARRACASFFRHSTRAVPPAEAAALEGSEGAPADDALQLLAQLSDQALSLLSPPTMSAELVATPALASTAGLPPILLALELQAHARLAVLTAATRAIPPIPFASLGTAAAVDISDADLKELQAELTAAPSRGISPQLLGA